MKNKLTRVAQEIVSESISTTWILFRILIPALIVVKILEYFGATQLLGELTQPLMQPLGLPDVAGLIWATTMLANIYTGIAVFMTLASSLDWTQAQATCLGILMLTTHNMVVELRIAQQAGCRFFTQLLFRVATAILFCFLLHQLFTITGWLQQPANFVWQPIVADDSILSWVINQVFSLLRIAVIIFVLIAVLKLFKALGLEQMLARALQPLFRLIGLAKEATTITIVGFTLGMAYGGGLLIREAQSEHIDEKDVFASISLLGICHSLIEDTLLVMIIGAHLYGVLFFRVIMSILVIAILIRFTAAVSNKFRHRFLVRSVSNG